tara:strand:- start:3899 stop:4216 length:318 start_codon:yes stop_codon:yes gene_type:complete
MEVKDARKRSKRIKEIKSKTSDGKHQSISVYQKSTPTKDKPGDTRLYKGEGVSSDPITASMGSERESLHKAYKTPSDSLSRADYKKLTSPPKEKPKKRRLFKRRK